MVHHRRSCCFARIAGHGHRSVTKTLWRWSYTFHKSAFQSAVEPIMEEIVKVAQIIVDCTTWPFPRPWACSKSTCRAHVWTIVDMRTCRIQEQLLKSMQLFPQEQIVGMPFAQRQEAAVEASRTCHTFWKGCRDGEVSVGSFQCADVEHVFTDFRAQKLWGSVGRIVRTVRKRVRSSAAVVGRQNIIQKNSSAHAKHSVDPDDFVPWMLSQLHVKKKNTTR